MTTTTRTKLMAAFIALSLCVTWFALMRAAANGNSKNSLTLYVFVADSHSRGHYDQLADVWKPRIGGNWIAGRLADTFAEDGRLTEAAYQNVFGAYNAGWLLLIFAALICWADNPLFVIPLVFAGLCYSLTPPDNVTFFPWDLPSMFFWTLSFLLWQRKHYPWMLATIVLGTVFKETVAVMAILFFFTTISWRRRWVFFGAAFVACLLLKLWISHAVMGQARIFTADSNGHLSFNVLKGLFTAQLNHVIWVNGGTFIVALFLPMKALADKGTKLVLIAFFAGLTMACVLAGTDFEFRQFLDVLPVSALYLNRTIQNWRTSEASPGTFQQRI
ncbi:MAG TPA: hypothetical protein VED19_00105 [Candidatus Nitrosopolaris sp.]|nr:hypothetical protein [Candidatus Nitrosopolaris sp.]